MKYLLLLLILLLASPAVAQNCVYVNGVRVCGPSSVTRTYSGPFRTRSVTRTRYATHRYATVGTSAGVVGSSSGTFVRYHSPNCPVYGYAASASVVSTPRRVYVSDFVEPEVNIVRRFNKLPPEIPKYNSNDICPTCGQPWPEND